MKNGLSHRLYHTIGPHVEAQRVEKEASTSSRGQDGDSRGSLSVWLSAAVSMWPFKAGAAVMLIMITSLVEHCNFAQSSLPPR